MSFPRKFQSYLVETAKLYRSSNCCSKIFQHVVSIDFNPSPTWWRAADLRISSVSTVGVNSLQLMTFSHANALKSTFFRVSLIHNENPPLFLKVTVGQWLDGANR